MVVGKSNHTAKTYEFSNVVPDSKPSSLLIHGNEDEWLWHERFGHLKYKYFQFLQNYSMVEGLPIIKSSKGICKICIVGKHPEHKFDQGKASRATCILGLIHSNISGPMPTTSMSGSRYVLTFIDDLSRFTWVYFLQKKSEDLEKFIYFKASVEISTGRKIKYMRSDSGDEYIKSYLVQIFVEFWRNIQHTVHYTRHQNGIAERKNRALKEMTTCMLESKYLDENIWDESMNDSKYFSEMFPTLIYQRYNTF